jgi:hypothetical protein
MGKHESVDAIRDQVDAAPAPSGATSATLVPADAPAAADDALKSALAAIESLKVESPKIESPAEEPKIDLSTMPAPQIDAPADAAKPAAAEMPGPEPMFASAVLEDKPERRISPFALMAASLGGAAAFGAMMGALIATGIARPVPVAAVAGPRIGVEEINALKEQIVQARVELAALKTNIDAGHRSANQQFTKVSERVERVERTQAEPVARLTKAIESLDRFERRADANASKDTTGTITPPQPVLAQPLKPPGGVEGWTVREVRRGTAYLEGRMGIIEVDQGDIVPGLGRVDAIRKQDGRWIVITSRGVIHQAR